DFSISCWCLPSLLILGILTSSARSWVRAARLWVNQSVTFFIKDSPGCFVSPAPSSRAAARGLELPANEVVRRYVPGLDEKSVLAEGRRGKHRGIRGSRERTEGPGGARKRRHRSGRRSGSPPERRRPQCLRRAPRGVC